MHSPRVVVVGTTSDYIELIRRRYPHRALFLTNPAERIKAREETPGPAEEILCHFTDDAEVLRVLKDHLRRYRLTVDGVACFDCEYLGSAAFLAQRLGLPFPSPSAVAQTRNKFLSKQAWKRAEVACPEAAVVRNRAEISKFLDRVGKSVILKPLTGSGGELVFRCADHNDCLQAYDTMINRLSKAGENRLYLQDPLAPGDLDPIQDVVLEEFIPGQEYSCDFFLENGRLEVIRTAKKIPTAETQVGATTAAYVVPAELPAEIPAAVFVDQLYRAATALGLDRALCMVDFIVSQGKAYLLELTPRPGGDCLPWLIQQSCGLDMIGLALDMAQRRNISNLSRQSWETLVGLRLFAQDAGTVKEIDEGDLRQDPRVQEVFIKRRPGHRVVLPPNDYDSRLFGHVIFRPRGSTSLETECVELASKLKVVMEFEG
ncbi:MAG: ATP-grasp domain-containing protein [Deltaproteobacteria bacterium]|nr:MAG: ATP-grasp domain-containing protein [Deltaproteobacteria bacterium]